MELSNASFLPKGASASGVASIGWSEDGADWEHDFDVLYTRAATPIGRSVIEEDADPALLDDLAPVRDRTID
jgi:hypothetical protein